MLAHLCIIKDVYWPLQANTIEQSVRNGDAALRCITLAICLNKAVIDRRLRPRCCHMGSYFKRSKSSLERPLACTWYYCAQFIAKPKATCALRFSLEATSINLGL